MFQGDLVVETDHGEQYRDQRQPPEKHIEALPAHRLVFEAGKGRRYGLIAQQARQIGIGGDQLVRRIDVAIGHRV